MTPPTATQDAADRALLWTPIQPPMDIAEMQCNAWLLWSEAQRRLAAVHDDYRARLAARLARRQAA